MAASNYLGELMTNYQYYRLNKVTVSYRMPKAHAQYNTVFNYNGVAGAGSSVTTDNRMEDRDWWCWIDYTGKSTQYTTQSANTAYGNGIVTQIMQKTNVHHKKSRNFSVTFRPKPLMTTYDSGAVTGAYSVWANKKNPWYSTNGAILGSDDTKIEHYGLNLYSQDALSNSVLSPNYESITTYYFSFKQRTQ